MPLDKQTIAGVILVFVAIGLIAWMTLDAWGIAAAEPIAEGGSGVAQTEIPLGDPKLC